jgi:broad specificity phosphatase PhoE
VIVPPDLEATLVLLRHGESMFITEDRFQGQADSPLSPLGLRQAELAAARLARPHRSPALPVPLRPPLEIVHSPLIRTTETASAVARALAEEHGVAPILRPDRGLLEVGQGEWEGVPRLEVVARWGDQLAQWRRTPTEVWAPGGEQLVEVQERVRSTVTSVLDGLAGAASAAGIGATSAASPVAGYPGPAAPETPWTIVVGHDGMFKVLLLTLLDLPLERFWSFPFAVAGISVVEFRAGRPILRMHNWTEHLAPLLDERAAAETEQPQRSGAL